MIVRVAVAIPLLVAHQLERAVAITLRVHALVTLALL